jgi:hypothetical protein
MYGLDDDHYYQQKRASQIRKKNKWILQASPIISYLSSENIHSSSICTFQCFSVTKLMSIKDKIKVVGRRCQFHKDIMENAKRTTQTKI